MAEANFLLHQNYYHFKQVGCQRRVQNREINIFAREINIFAREINILPGEINIKNEQKGGVLGGQKTKIPIRLGISQLLWHASKH